MIHTYKVTQKETQGTGSIRICFLFLFFSRLNANFTNFSLWANKEINN